MRDLKHGTDEPIYKTERLRQGTDLGLPSGEGERGPGSLGLEDANYYI